MSFKAGDKVRCKVGRPGQFTQGKTYEVDCEDKIGGLVWIKADDSGNTNAWLEENFEFAALPDWVSVSSIEEALGEPKPVFRCDCGGAFAGDTHDDSCKLVKLGLWSKFK